MSPAKQATPYASPESSPTKGINYIPVETNDDIKIDKQLRQWVIEVEENPDYDPEDSALEKEVKEKLTEFRNNHYSSLEHETYDSIEDDLTKSILEYTPEEFLELELFNDDNDSFGEHQHHVILKYKTKYITMMLDRVKFWYITDYQSDMFNDNYYDHSDPQSDYIRFLNDVYTKYHMVLSPIMTNFIKDVLYHKKLKGKGIEYGIEDYDSYRKGKYREEKNMKHPMVKGVNPNVLGEANSRFDTACGDESESSSGGAGRGKGGKGLGKGGSKRHFKNQTGSWVCPPGEDDY